MRYLTNDLDAAGLPTWADSDADLSPYSGPAARFWDFVADDEHPYGADMIVREVTTPHGTFRACVRDDLDPAPPEFEAGDPVNRIPSGSYPSLGEVEYGTDEHAGVDIREVWDRLYLGDGRHAAVELVDRYLRIFHGGAARMLTSSTYQGGDDYLVWTTQAQRDAHGRPATPWSGDDLLESEWQAYIDGEVYSVAVERATDFDGDGKPTAWAEAEGPVCGHYGTAWAMQAAEDMLHDELEHVAGQMLPLGGAL